MKLQELFTASLFERRRNPEMSERATGHAAAVAYLQARGQSVATMGVSMTTIPKLGINPGSKYNTPIGIYFYPATYYLETKLDKSELEFQDSAPYIQIFKYSGAVLNIDTVDRDQFSQYITTLTRNLDNIAQLVDYKGPDVSAWFYSIVADATTQAAHHSVGGHLWYILYTLCSSANKGPKGQKTPRSAIVWNKLFRMLGVDVIVDSGAGIIHKNEPVQGVVINPNAVSLLKTISNVGGGAHSAAYKKLEKMSVDSWGELQTLIDSIVDTEMDYDPNYAKQTRAVLNKCWKFLTANPKIFSKLDDAQLDVLLRLTDDEAVKKQFRETRAVLYYEKKFPEWRADADALVKTIDQAAHGTTPTDERTMRIVFRNQIYKLKNTAWALEKHAHIDKSIADMHTYFKDSLATIETLIGSVKSV